MDVSLEEEKGRKKVAEFKGLADLKLLAGVNFDWHPFILADLVQIGLLLGVADENVNPRSTLRSMGTAEIEIPEFVASEVLNELQQASISDPEKGVEIAEYHHNKWYLAQPMGTRFMFGTLHDRGYYPMYAIKVFFKVPYEDCEQSLTYWKNDLESVEAAKMYHDIFRCRLIFDVSSPRLQTPIGEMFARRHYLARD